MTLESQIGASVGSSVLFWEGIRSLVRTELLLEINQNFFFYSRKILLGMNYRYFKVEEDSFKNGLRALSSRMGYRHI